MTMQSSRGGWPNWRLIRLSIGLFLLFVAIFVTYLWRLGSLTAGLSPLEASARGNSAELNLIEHSPLYALHKLLQLGFQSIDHLSTFWLRLPSVLLGLILVGCFFYIARGWFGKLSAALATLLFALTPWVILLSRSALPDILLLSPLALLAGYLRFSRQEEKRWRTWLLVMSILGLCLYVPGMFWVVLLAFIISRSRLRQLTQSMPIAMLTAGLILCLIIVLPLVWAIFQDWRLIKPWLLIPAHWQGVTDSLRSISWSALALVWHARQHTDLLIDRLAILSVAQIALMIVGTWAMWHRARIELIGLFALAAFGIVAAGLNQNLMLVSFALAAAGLIVAAGLRYLYIQWRQVFPRNPLPRALALILMTSLIGAQVVFGLRYSLIAWPHTLDTRHTYVLK